MQLARQALAVLGWTLVTAVIVQVFFAGVGLFGVAGMDWHIGLGYWLPLLPLLMLLLAWPARPGRGTVALYALLFVMLAVQTILPTLRQGAPVVAALHPPNALLIFGLSFVLARRATALAAIAGRPG